MGDEKARGEETGSGVRRCLAVLGLLLLAAGAFFVVGESTRSLPPAPPSSPAPAAAMAAAAPASRPVLPAAISAPAPAPVPPGPAPGKEALPKAETASRVEKAAAGTEGEPDGEGPAEAEGAAAKEEAPVEDDPALEEADAPEPGPEPDPAAPGEGRPETGKPAGRDPYKVTGPVPGLTPAENHRINHARDLLDIWYAPRDKAFTFTFPDDLGELRSLQNRVISLLEGIDRIPPDLRNALDNLQDKIDEYIHAPPEGFPDPAAGMGSRRGGREE